MEKIKNRSIIWLYKNRITNKCVFSKCFTGEGFSCDEWDLVGEIILYKSLKPEFHFYKEY